MTLDVDRGRGTDQVIPDATTKRREREEKTGRGSRNVDEARGRSLFEMVFGGGCRVENWVSILFIFFSQARELSGPARRARTEGGGRRAVG